MNTHIYYHYFPFFYLLNVAQNPDIYRYQTALNISTSPSNHSRSGQFWLVHLSIIKGFLLIYDIHEINVNYLQIYSSKCTYTDVPIPMYINYKWPTGAPSTYPDSLDKINKVRTICEYKILLLLLTFGKPPQMLTLLLFSAVK